MPNSTPGNTHHPHLPHQLDITRETKISLPLVITMLTCTFVIAGSMWAFMGRVEALKHEIDGLKSDRYTQSQAAENALRNAIGNPGIKFADPRNPGQYIVVDSGRVTTTP